MKLILNDSLRFPKHSLHLSECCHLLSERLLALGQHDLKNAEQGGAIDMATYSAAVIVARASAQALTDEAALEVKAIYRTWEELRLQQPA